MSILSLHRLAPRAVHCCLDKVIPVISDGTFIANLTMDGICFDKRKTGDDTWFPVGLAVIASKSTVIDT